jgi:hypothetical protein
MAFTYLAPIKVTSLTVGTQVVAAVVADGHSYVYPTPAAASGLQYPTVRALFAAPLPPGDATAGDALTTVQLSGNAFTLPQDFTINGNTDWVLTATGTA